MILLFTVLHVLRDGTRVVQNSNYYNKTIGNPGPEQYNSVHVFHLDYNTFTDNSHVHLTLKWTPQDSWHNVGHS